MVRDRSFKDFYPSTISILQRCRSFKDLHPSKISIRQGPLPCKDFYPSMILIYIYIVLYYIIYLLYLFIFIYIIIYMAAFRLSSGENPSQCRRGVLEHCVGILYSSIPTPYPSTPRRHKAPVQWDQNSLEKVESSFSLWIIILPGRYFVSQKWNFM